MKILISADMEGISGVVSEDHVSTKGNDYEKMREVMTQEVNYAIEGALAGGATEVTVNDSHGSMRNIIPTLLHKEALLITGGLKELSMVEGLSEDIDGAFLVGYHAHRGTVKAIMDHTYSGRVVKQVWVNGKEMGETGINALVAGTFQVPVLLVTGDDKVCKEAEELFDTVYTVAVKTALSRFAAKCLHPEKAGELIRAKAEKAVSDIQSFKPLTMEGPYRLEADVVSPEMADAIQLIPGVTRVGATHVQYSHEDLITLFKAFRLMLTVGG